MMWTIQPRSEGEGALSYWHGGSGAPLVLIHGVGLRAEAWAAVMPDLAKQFQVFAIDMPGHGSSPLAEAAELNHYVARVLQFVDALDGPVRIAGHSMGAMIALAVAAKRPGDVCAVAALNAVFRRGEKARRAVQARATALSQTHAADPAVTLERWFGAAPEGAMLEAAQACSSWLTSTDPRGYARAYSVFAAEDGPSDADLEQLVAPALFLTGALDPNSTPAMSKAMARGARNGKAEVISDAAHMMPMTHPAEVTDHLLRVFSFDGGSW